MNINFPRILLVLIIIPFIQSCAPVLGGLGAVAIGGAAKEKGIGTAFNDNVVKVNILNAFYKLDENIADNLKVSVDDGSVLLTGTVKTSDESINFLDVLSKYLLNDVSNVKNIARDFASVGEIRAKILANVNINSLNFSINVVNDIAYLSGIAANQEEINLITNIAKNARFVKEVYNYIRINPDKR